MARVKGAMMTRKRRNKKLGLAKGYWGNKSRHFKMANEQLMKSGRYAYVGRKLKKRDFRSLSITLYFRRGAGRGQAALYLGANGDQRMLFQQFRYARMGLALPVVTAGMTQKAGTDQNRHRDSSFPLRAA